MAAKLLTDRESENDMCVYCGGSLQESTMDYVEKIDNYVIVIKNVPCEKCSKIESILDSIQKISSEITVTVIDFSTLAA